MIWQDPIAPVQPPARYRLLRKLLGFIGIWLHPDGLAPRRSL